MPVISARISEKLNSQIEEAVEAGRFKSKSETVIHCLEVGLGQSLIDEIREVIRGELRNFRPRQKGPTPNPKKAKLLQQMRR